MDEMNGPVNMHHTDLVRRLVQDDDTGSFEEAWSRFLFNRDQSDLLKKSTMEEIVSVLVAW